MSDTDRGPIQTYEVTWASGHVERLHAHQVTMPGGLADLFGGARQQQKRIAFHAEVDGRWTLVLLALEQDVRTIRNVTVDEPVPGGAS